MTLSTHRRFLLLIAGLLLGACSVCEQHPTACKVVAVVGGVVIVGAIVRGHQQSADASRSQIPGNPDCSKPGLCN
jgi:hypothetical protein